MVKSTSNRHNLRLPEYDYSQQGAYYVTIITHNRMRLFGEICKGEMVLNQVGTLAEQVWKEIPFHFKNVELGDFVIMPNHIHGIIIINNTEILAATHASPLPDSSEHISNAYDNSAPLRAYGNTVGKTSGPRPGSLGAIIGSFKSATSKRMNRCSASPIGSIWQRNYYEHIIRDYKDWQAISDYILTNPQNWNKDEEYQE